METELSWHELQEKLRECTSEEEAQRIMDAEKAGPARFRWMKRIQGRIRTLRKERENRELLQTSPKGNIK